MYVTVKNVAAVAVAIVDALPLITWVAVVLKPVVPLFTKSNPPKLVALAPFVLTVIIIRAVNGTAVPDTAAAANVKDCITPSDVVPAVPYRTLTIPTPAAVEVQVPCSITSKEVPAINLLAGIEASEENILVSVFAMADVADVNAPAPSSLETVAFVAGNVIVVASVPASVKLLLAVNVLPAAIVSTPVPVVKVLPLTVVATNAPIV